MSYEPCETHMRANLGEHMLQGLRDLSFWLPRKMVMAEIGIYAGESTRIFIESGKVVRLTAVDPWSGDYDQGDGGWHSPFDWNEVYLVFSRYAAQHPEIDTRRMTSLEAARLMPDGSLDFVYIDSNHRYEAARDDIGAWLPKVKRGGWLGGHDWSPAYPGVARAVRAFRLPEPKLFQDTSWLVQI